jgi:hypothetical protein
MESENPFIRLMLFGKIKKMVNSYKYSKLKQIDKRRLRVCLPETSKILTRVKGRELLIIVCCSALNMESFQEIQVE